MDRTSKLKPLLSIRQFRIPMTNSVFINDALTTKTWLYNTVIITDTKVS